MRSSGWSSVAAAAAVLVAMAACSSSSSPAGSEDAGVPDAKHDPDTWNNFAQEFCATYCVHCHDATTPDPTTDPNQNFNLYSDVKGFASEIRCGVSPAGELQSGCPTNGAFPPPGQFPAGAPYPSDAERLRMIAWIEAGAPEGE